MQRITFEDITNTLLERACDDFYRSEEGRLAREKAQKADDYLKTNFLEDDYNYIMECVGDMGEYYHRESIFLYCRGYMDCVKMLKELKVI